MPQPRPPIAAPTRTEWFDHEGTSLEVLLPVAADELIDEAEFERDERLPYWAELWPSARALARHLLAHPPASPVLELGCGLALPSLALHALGIEVLATDYYDDVIRFAEVNSARNGLPPLPTALLDWRKIPASMATFPTVIAADVLYERRNAEALALAVPRLVDAGGRFLLADPGRTFAALFLDSMEAAGWHVHDLGIREETSDPDSGAVSRVRITELVRNRAE
jgi:predicted nicotinamide N-methyase